MKARAKSVAGVLVAVLLVAPAVALVSCAHNMGQMAGDPGMAMTGMPPAGAEFSSVSLSACCLDSPAEVTPSLLRANEMAAVSVSTAQAGRSERPIMPVAEDGTLRVNSPPGQALLCVFLI